MNGKPWGSSSVEQLKSAVTDDEKSRVRQQIDNLRYNQDKQHYKLYQTASRLFHWLRYKEFIDKHPSLCQGVKYPEKFLVLMPNRPKTVEDENCAIVTRAIPGLKPLAKLSDTEKCAAVTPNKIPLYGRGYEIRTTLECYPKHRR